MTAMSLAGLFAVGLVLGWIFFAMLESPNYRRFLLPGALAVLLSVTLGGLCYAGYGGRAAEAALWAAGAIFAALELWGVWNARRQERVLGISAYRECMAVTKSLGRYSGRILTLGALKWAAISGGVLIILYQPPANPNLLLLALALLLIVTGLGQRGQQRVAATILVLGASADEQISLQAAIRQAVFPFRPVSLLQTGVAAIDNKIPGDCFRIDRGIDWENAVFTFCRVLPLVILDIRQVTPLVREEIAHVVRERYLHKTIFIGEREPEMLEEERAGHAPALCVRDAPAAIGFLRHLFFQQQKLPAGDATVRRLFDAWQNPKTA